MPDPIFLSHEQLEFAKRCKAEAEKFAKTPLLLGNKGAIDLARTLIEQAAELGLPAVAYSGLQIVVSMHDTEMALPEHLRSFKNASSS